MRFKISNARSFEEAREQRQYIINVQSFARNLAFPPQNIVNKILLISQTFTEGGVWNVMYKLFNCLRSKISEKNFQITLTFSLAS